MPGRWWAFCAVRVSPRCAARPARRCRVPFGDDRNCPGTQPRRPAKQAGRTSRTSCTRPALPAGVRAWGPTSWNLSHTAACTQTSPCRFCDRLAYCSAGSQAGGPEDPNMWTRQPARQRDVRLSKTCGRVVGMRALSQRRRTRAGLDQETPPASCLVQPQRVGQLHSILRGGSPAPAKLVSSPSLRKHAPGTDAAAGEQHAWEAAQPLFRVAGLPRGQADPARGTHHGAHLDVKADALVMEEAIVYPLVLSPLPCPGQLQGGPQQQGDGGAWRVDQPGAGRTVAMACSDPGQCQGWRMRREAAHDAGAMAHRDNQTETISALCAGEPSLPPSRLLRAGHLPC